ncbi:MAG: glutamine-hydrolyzing GMP synthase [bacterium]
MTRDRGSAGSRERIAEIPSDRVPPFPRSPVPDTVIVLDFGAQYAQLIARRIREAKVRSLILPYDTPVAELLAVEPRGLILSGGPASVYEAGAPRADPALFHAGIPMLGICYGMQLMAHDLGGRTAPADQREYGRTRLHVDDRGTLFAGLEAKLLCWMSHGDSVVEVPGGFRPLAHTDNSPIAAMADPARRLYGLQFHPEVTHTPWGSQVLQNFLYHACGCRPQWTMASFIETEVDAIRRRAGSSRAICALSGGVDSAAAAALVHQAIGDQLTCIFVDHGLLRRGEAAQVVRTFRDHFQMPLVHVDARARFLDRLAGMTDPEAKRRRIGEEFIAIFEEEAAQLGKIDYLVQGTLYPDVIESGTRTASRIKTHHNVGGLPETMHLGLIEPFRELFKDEVREVARQLGLPDEMVWRHPFPGPGLAVRILGEVTPERLDLLRAADAVVLEELRAGGKMRDIWQAFAVLLPVHTVGVKGDARTFGHAVIVRAVTSEDGMTADWARLSDDLLERIASRITREVPAVTRVAYDITSKPPATIEWE